MKKRTQLVLMSAAILTVASATMHSSELGIFSDNVKAESNESSANKVTSDDITVAKADRNLMLVRMHNAQKDKALFADLKTVAETNSDTADSKFDASHSLIQSIKSQIDKARLENESRNDEIKNDESELASIEDKLAKIEKDKNDEIAKLEELKKAVDADENLISDLSRLIDAKKLQLKEKSDEAYSLYKKIIVSKRKIESNTDLIEYQSKFVELIENGIDSIKKEFNGKVDLDDVTSLLDAANKDFIIASSEFDRRDRKVIELMKKRDDEYLAEKLKSLKAYSADIVGKSASVDNINSSSDSTIKTATLISDSSTKKPKIMTPIVKTESKRSNDGEFIVRSVDTEGRALDEVRYDYKDGGKLTVEPQSIEHYSHLKAAFVALDGSSIDVDPTKPFEASKRGTLIYVYDKTEIEDPSDRIQRPKTPESDSETKKTDTVKDSSTNNKTKSENDTVDQKSNVSDRRAALITQMDRSNGLQRSDDGILTHVILKKVDGKLTVEGSISKDLLSPHSIKDQGFDKVIIKLSDGSVVGEFKINDDYSFKGYLSKTVEMNSSLLFEYGGKTYNFTYREQNERVAQSSENDNHEETLSANSDDSSSTNSDTHRDSDQQTSKTSKDKILPKTGQSSNIVSIVVGSIMTVAGISITLIKKFAKM